MTNERLVEITKARILFERAYRQWDAMVRVHAKQKESLYLEQMTQVAPLDRMRLDTQNRLSAAYRAAGLCPTCGAENCTDGHPAYGEQPAEPSVTLASSGDAAKAKCPVCRAPMDLWKGQVVCLHCNPLLNM